MFPIITSELETFLVALLWHFKPEYRELLPLFDEKEELKLESELLTLHIFNLQHEETGQGNSVLSFGQE
jgi:hypothetical protein